MTYLRTATLLVPFGLEGDVRMSITCSLFVSGFTIISNMDVPKIHLVKITEGEMRLFFLYSMRCEKHHRDYLGTPTKKKDVHTKLGTKGSSISKSRLTKAVQYH